MINSTKLFLACAIFIAISPASQASSQVQTNVPDVAPSAKPVTVEHIKVQGAALEGNLERDAGDRDVIVFLRLAIKKTRGVAIPWFMRCTATPSARSSGRTKSTYRRPSKVRSRWARRR